jgi:hypothetical protein
MEEERVIGRKGENWRYSIGKKEEYWSDWRNGENWNGMDKEEI